MWPISSIIAALVISVFSLTAPAIAADRVGTVKTMTGAAESRSGADISPLKVGDPIAQNAVLTTQTDSTLGLTLNDGTLLSLGPDAELIVDSFVYDPAQKDVGLGLSFLAGTMSYVSGRIAKIAPDSVAVTTPSATIGIRGKRFVLRVSE